MNVTEQIQRAETIVTAHEKWLEYQKAIMSRHEFMEKHTGLTLAKTTLANTVNQAIVLMSKWNDSLQKRLQRQSDTASAEDLDDGYNYEED